MFVPLFQNSSPMAIPQRDCFVLKKRKKKEKKNKKGQKKREKRKEHQRCDATVKIDKYLIVRENNHLRTERTARSGSKVAAMFKVDGHCVESPAPA